MEADEPILMSASQHISINHIQQLATGYLDFTKPEFDNLPRDGDSVEIIFNCLLIYCRKQSCRTQELSDVLEKAGREEGLVSRTAVDILRGKKAIPNSNKYFCNNNFRAHEGGISDTRHCLIFPSRH